MPGDAPPQDVGFRFLAEMLPVQIWTATPDGRLDYISEQTAARLGRKVSEILAEGWQNVVHPDDLPRALDRWSHALSTGELYEIEFRLKVASGAYLWHLGRAVPQRGPNGAIVRWFGTNTEIEEQRRQQAQTRALLDELEQQTARIEQRDRLVEAERSRILADSQRAQAMERSSRERLQVLFQKAPAPICILEGPEHRFVLANPKYRELVGNRDVVGLTVREALPELAGQGFFELLERVSRTGERFTGNELPVKLAQEGSDTLSEAILDFVYEPFYEQDGKVAGILVLATDVTEKVRVRRDLEQTLVQAARLNRELAEAESVLRSLVNNLPGLAWSALPDGYIDFYNQGWFDYTGTRPQDMQGWGWQAVHDPELLPSVVERWKHSIASGSPFEMEFPLRGVDGTFQWFLTRVKPLRDSAGTIVRWFGTNTNIHEQREARRKIMEASMAKDEFLATASHELRTPLSAILGWSRLLRGGQVEPSAYARGLETIERNARAQVRLIEDILDGSRIITGQLHLEVRSLDLTVLIHAALDSVRLAADAKQIELVVELDADAARVLGDPERLQQVVWNLVNNAVKFTPRGGRVEVRLQRSGTHIELAVADNGQGIRRDFLPHVFDRFRQAEGSTTRRHGGLGLGLALVRHLAEAHGGTVRAESEGEGRGARFCVLLPVQAVFAEPEVVRQRPTPTEPLKLRIMETQGLAKVRVLVVDDEPDARELVATVLRAAGATVMTAGSAGEALALFNSFVPMILVSDVGMPVTDGYELMRQLRANAGKAGAELPAIALTAYSREQDRRLALEAGFQTHVAKPVEPAELVRVVSSLLEFVERQPSSVAREAVLEKADAFLKFEKILGARGVEEALRFLNSRTSHRFTGIHRFEPPLLRCVLLVDSDSNEVGPGRDAPLAETHCSFIALGADGFSTEDGRADPRLEGHPARERFVSYSGVALRGHDGAVLGSLCHFDSAPCDIAANELPLMQAVAPLLLAALAARSRPRE